MPGIFSFLTIRALKRGFHGIEITNSPGVPERVQFSLPNLGYRCSSLSCVVWHHFGAISIPGTLLFSTIRAPKMGFSHHIQASGRCRRRMLILVIKVDCETQTAQTLRPWTQLNKPSRLATKNRTWRHQKVPRPTDPCIPGCPGWCSDWSQNGRPKPCFWTIRAPERLESSGNRRSSLSCVDSRGLVVFWGVHRPEMCP